MQDFIESLLYLDYFHFNVGVVFIHIRRNQLHGAVHCSPLTVDDLTHDHDFGSQTCLHAIKAFFDIAPLCGSATETL